MHLVVNNVKFKRFREIPIYNKKYLIKNEHREKEKQTKEINEIGKLVTVGKN